MIIKELPGFQIHTCLHDAGYGGVYRALRVIDSSAVILKVVAKTHARFDYLNHLRNEYDILSSLSEIKGVPKVLDFLEEGPYLILVLADFEGCSLDELIQSKQFSSEQTVAIIGECLGIIEAIHKAHVIHKDIKPANILWDAKSQKVWVIDFGLAIRFNQKLDQFYQPTSTAGSLCYMPPEQTGRVNRQVDYRSDYYSLGVTAYQMLTTKLPFEPARSAHEFLYELLATEAASPHEVQASIPEALSMIVMRLIEKDAENRYQTVSGILYDLSSCLDGERFELGMQDVPDRFSLPNHVYGREPELDVLTRMFSGVVAGEQCRALVAGYSGVGKTALVHELYRDVSRAQGYLIEGKFDQLQRNEPLFGFIKAFDDFFSALLTEPEITVKRWRESLVSRLGENAGVVTQHISSLEHLIGVQPEPLYLAGEEGLNRLIYAFQTLIQTVASPQHPLVMFIDDLQWVDDASLKLIEKLFYSNEVPYTMVIGAYRNNEVEAGHPLHDLIVGAQADQIIFEHMHLENLSLTATTRIVEDGFQNRMREPEVLAHFIYEKTAGNPFFMIQFINKMVNEGLISMDAQGRWFYDLEQLRMQQVAENVVELMSDKIRSFSEDASDLLCIAAAIGHEFDLLTLKKASDLELDAVKQQLLPALQSGMLIASQSHFQFAHDGIQHAALYSSDVSKRFVVHHRIGKLLLDECEGDGALLKKRIFDICFHLNSCQTEDLSAAELGQRLTLNVQAAIQAKQSAAYQTAYQYIVIASELLSEATPEQQKSHSFKVYREAADCAFLCGQPERGESYLSEAESQAHKNFEKCQLANLKVTHLVSEGDYVNSMTLGISALGLYGLALPPVSDDLAVQRYYDEQHQTFIEEWLAQGKTVAELFELPVCCDEEVGLLMELLGSLYASALMSYPDYLKVITIVLVNLSIDKGNTSISPIGYAWHGSSVASISEDYDQAYAFGALAIRLNEEKIKNPTIACKIYNMVGNFITFFKEPLRQTLPQLRRAYELGIVSGDRLYAGYSIINELRNALSTGMPISSWLSLDDEVKIKLEQCDGQVMIEVRESFRAHALRLSGQSRSSAELDNDNFSEQAYREKYAAVPLFGALLDSWKIQSSYLLGHLDQALLLSCFDATPIDSFVLGTEMRFFAALTLLRCLRDEPESESAQQKRECVARYRAHLDTLAGHCPENFRHMKLMLMGEEARTQGDVLSAASFFDQAIRNAKENEFLQYEALANELLGRTYLASGIIESGRVHIEQAYSLYFGWGAFAKQAALEQEFSDINFLGLSSSNRSHSGSSFVDKEEISHRVDLRSVVEASLALSSEMDINRLLEQLMTVVVEGSGAQHSVLLLHQENQWRIVAEKGDGKGVEKELEKGTGNRAGTGSLIEIERMFQSVDPEGHMPLSVLNYVIRTGESIVLGDAQKHKAHAKDAYIEAHAVKSLMCLPLVHQGQMRAVLYLENNLGKNVFSQEKSARLKLLSSQMAAAIRNAENYQRLSESEHQYRSLLKSLPIGVIVCDASTRITYANPLAYQAVRPHLNDMTGLKLSELEGTIYDEAGEVVETRHQPVYRVLTEKIHLHGEVYGYRMPGEEGVNWYMISAFPQFKGSQIESIVICLLDITERRQNEERIQHLAFYDVLTDLPNRTHLENNLSQVITRAVAKDQCSAIVLLDLDNFNEINDALGHWVGDKMLNRVVERIRSILEADMLFSRVGGDEFALVFTELFENQEAIRERVDCIVRLLRHLFESPFEVEGHQLTSSASFGAAIAPADGDNVEELLRHADIALNHSKKDGRNSLTYFKAEQESALQRRLELERDLRAAIDKQQLSLVYQPKVDIKSGRVVGAEALVRWQHPEKGPISPIEFIPIAEDSGLILELGEWVLLEACCQASQWSKHPGFDSFKRMSVNVSPFQFKHQGFAASVDEALDTSGLQPQQLDIEVTEYLLLEHTELIVDKLDNLRAMGITLSIDDFGTGYSSLSYLKRLPVDTLKVDQSFVRDMTTDDDDRAIVETVLAMAKNLGLQTVAEGVETEEHLRLLDGLGCHLYQGYYFSKPISADEFAKLMQAP